MYKTGLCSVTFRDLTAEQVIELTLKAELEGIEWGGDVHVPPGDDERALEVATLTEQANLDIVSYGSYYRVGHNKANAASFEKILETTVKLRAPAVRVWAGSLGSREADEKYRESVVADAKRIASLAEKVGVSIHFEYHGNSLTDTPESAAQLMRDIDHSNIHLYWQPAVGERIANRIASIQQVRPWLTHVHVFQWTNKDRLPLEAGIEEWDQYLHELKKLNESRYLLLEFIKSDNSAQFLQDADTLKNLVGTYNKKV